MAALTQLSPIGLPGSRYSFLAKTAAGVSARGSDLFTSISVTATPGKRQSFTAKSLVGASARGSDLFTTLHVDALPGPRYAFSPKTSAAAIVAAPVTVAEWLGGKPPRKRRILDADFPEESLEFVRKATIRLEDERLLEMIANLLTSGVLK